MHSINESCDRYVLLLCLDWPLYMLCYAEIQVNWPYKLQIPSLRTVLHGTSFGDWPDHCHVFSARHSCTQCLALPHSTNKLVTFELYEVCCWVICIGTYLKVWLINDGNTGFINRHLQRWRQNWFRNRAEGAILSKINMTELSFLQNKQRTHSEIQLTLEARM